MTNSQNKRPTNIYSGRNFKYSGMYFSTINNFLQIQCPNFVFKVKKGKKRNTSTKSYTIWFNVLVFGRLKCYIETQAEIQNYSLFFLISFFSLQIHMYLVDSCLVFFFSIRIVYSISLLQISHVTLKPLHSVSPTPI